MTQHEPKRKPAGRLVRAWRALRGHAEPCMTCAEHIAQLQHEWRAYELALNGYMDKMGAWAARQAKRDRVAGEAVLANTQPQAGYELQGTPAQATKSELRTQHGLALAAGRLGPARLRVNQVFNAAGGDGGGLEDSRPLDTINVPKP